MDEIRENVSVDAAGQEAQSEVELGSFYSNSTTEDSKKLRQKRNKKGVESNLELCVWQTLILLL